MTNAELVTIGEDIGKVAGTPGFLRHTYKEAHEDVMKELRDEAHRHTTTPD